MAIDWSASGWGYGTGICAKYSKDFKSIPMNLFESPYRLLLLLLFLFVLYFVCLFLSTEQSTQKRRGNRQT